MNKKFIVKITFALTTCILCSSNILAKEGTIKYGKFLVYEGEVENKLPSGSGTLYLLNPKNKKENFCTISGVFADNVIASKYDPLHPLTSENPAQFSSVNFADFSATGSVTLRYKGDKKKCQSFDVILKDCTIKGDIKVKLEDGTEKTVPEIIANLFTISFTQTDEGWHYEIENQAPTSELEKVFYTDSEISSNVFTAETGNSLLQSSVVDKFKYSTKRAIARFGIDKYYISAKTSPIYVINNDLAYSNYKFFNTKYHSTFYTYGDSWRGDVILDDETMVSKKAGEKTLNIVFPDGSKFVGTLTENSIFFPLYKNTVITPSLFYEGEYTKDGNTERWIKGESLSVLHKRIVNLYDEDLVAKIESGSVKEDEAASIQRIRENEKAAAEREAREKAENEKAAAEREARVKAEYAAILQSRWKCSDILFGGRFKGTIDGDKVFRALWGIDHTYFDGEVLLALNADGEAAFAALSWPSQKAIYEGRGRALQVNFLCQDGFTKRIENGKWSIEGEKIIVTGMAEDWTLTINKGGQTIKCSMRGMLASTLKIMQKK